MQILASGNHMVEAINLASQLTLVAVGCAIAGALAAAYKITKQTLQRDAQLNKEPPDASPNNTTSSATR